MAAMAAVLLCASCAPPPFSAAAQIDPERLYALSSLDAQVTLLDGASGRMLGQPLPVGHAPHQLVVDPSGSSLVATGSGVEVLNLLDPASAVRRTHGATPGERPRTRRPLALEDGARPRLLAGDGAGHVLVAYDVENHSLRGGIPCRLAVIDVSRAVVAHTHRLCAEGETITGLAAAHTPGGTVAYAALWRPARALPAVAGTSAAAPDSAIPHPASARIVAIDTATGAVVGVTALHGQPRPVQAGGSLLLAPAPTHPLPASNPATYVLPTLRLYVVEALPGPVWATWNEEEYAWAYRLSTSWSLKRFAGDLALESSIALDFAPSGLAVTPNGAHGYAFDILDDRLMEIDLVSGHTAPLARVPGSGHVPAGLVASASHVYAAAPRRNEVWTLEPHTGKRVIVMQVGRFPVGLALVPQPPPVLKAAPI